MIGHQIKFFTLAALTFFMLSSPVAAEEAPSTANKHIGKATFTQGSVLLQREGNAETLTLSRGDMVYLNDTVLTDEGDYATIEFIDETSITLNGADGSLRIDEYVFDTDTPQHNKARFNILRASFLYASGSIGKTDKPDVKIDLDFGTIGIRGTKILRAMKKDECWILLEDGLVQVSNGGGTVNMKPGDGTRMHATNIGPTRPEPWSEKNIAWIHKEVKLPEIIEE